MRCAGGLPAILFGLLVGIDDTVFPSENRWKIPMQSRSGGVGMDDILLGVLKGGEVVVDFAGEIYQKVRSRGDEDGESDGSNQTEPP